jgi:hypothetical protein
MVESFPETAQDFKGLQSVKTHDLEILLKFSGVEDRVRANRMAEWSVVLDWNLGGSVTATHALRRAMHEIAARKGSFTLFALFMRADDPGTWDLVISAPWLDRGKLKALGELVDLLAKSIGRQALQQFSRVEAVPGNHPSVQFILRDIPVEDGERQVQSTDLFGLEIERGIIFRAWRPAAKRPATKALHPAAAGSSRSRG